MTASHASEVVTPAPVPPSHPVLTVKDLRIGYRGADGAEVIAVDGVNLTIEAGETLGLVGESGCGKSTLARAILQLQPSSGGTITFEGSDLATLSSSELRRLRRRLQVVFQDPGGSLDPKMRLAEIVTEVLKLNRSASRKERLALAAEILEEVGMDPALVQRRPSQLSGGQQQRVALARALISRPALVVLDEPVSALDVSIQAKVINLLQDLQESHQVAYLFIAHNLAVVRHLSHRVAVMYLGKIVEIAPAHNLFANPVHPYSKALIASVLHPDESARERLETVRQLAPGEMPSLSEIPTGCRYHTRCPFADEKCRTEEPPLLAIKGKHSEQHAVACHHWPEVADTLVEVRAR